METTIKAQVKQMLEEETVEGYQETLQQMFIEFTASDLFKEKSSIERSNFTNNFMDIYNLVGKLNQVER